MTEPTDDVDGDEDRSESEASPPTLLQRLFSPAASPTVGPLPTNAKGVTTKWSVDHLDPKEKLYGYLAGVVAIVFAVLIYVVDNHRHLKAVKGQLSPETSLILGLVGGAALIASTRLGRRALVGFVALFTFLGFSSNIFLGLPFFLLAIWLLFRSYKVQKEATARVRAEKAAGGRTAGERTRSPRSAAASGRQAATARAAAKKGPARPEGNKRFTPKKPTPGKPPEPKPSWRDRRAAKAADH